MASFYDVNMIREDMPASIKPMSARPPVGAQIWNAAPNRTLLMRWGAYANESEYYYTGIAQPLVDENSDGPQFFATDQQMAQNKHFELRAYEIAYSVLSSEQSYPSFPQILQEQETQIEIDEHYTQGESKERDYNHVLTSTTFLPWPNHIKRDDNIYDLDDRVARYLSSRIAVMGVVQAVDGTASTTGRTTTQRTGPVSYVNFGPTPIYENDLVKACVASRADLNGSHMGRAFVGEKRTILMPKRVDWATHDSMDLVAIRVFLTKLEEGLNDESIPAKFSAKWLAEESSKHFNEYECALLFKFVYFSVFVMVTQSDKAENEKIFEGTFKELVTALKLLTTAESPNHLLAHQCWTAAIQAERAILRMHDSTIFARSLTTMMPGHEGMLTLGI